MGGLAGSQRALSIAAATSPAGVSRAANGLAFLSAASCLLAAVFWARSYRFDESLNYLAKGDSDDYSLRSYLGRVHFLRSQQLFLFRERVQSRPIDWESPPWADRPYWFDEYGVNDFWAGWGFGYARGTMPVFGIGRPRSAPDASTMAFVVPYWFLVTASAALPGSRVVQHLRRRRRRGSGRCMTCGYDLRASPDKCPECGADVEMR